MFYDGYVVNAVMDACFRSAASRGWEPVEFAGTAARHRASAALRARAATMIKAEHLLDGPHKLIVKDPTTGEFVDRVV